MIRRPAARSRPLSLLLVSALAASIGAGTVAGGERQARKARRSAFLQEARLQARTDPTYGSRLGTFNPSPAIIVQGNYPVAGGYAPLGIYGSQNMSLYGPFSALRTTTAPVLTYVRGYDGVTRPVEGVSTSNPLLPYVSPLAYPTRANNYYAPRIPTNPAEQSAYMWIDQN